MKKLLIIALLSPLFCCAQLNPQCYTVDIKTQQIREKRAKQVGLTCAVLFAIAEIGLQANNKKVWNAGNTACLIVGSVGIVYVINSKNGVQKGRNKLQLLHRRKVPIYKR